MMCLGWYNRPTCAAREQIQVAPGVSPCPSSMWFYLSAAAILIAGMMKGKSA
jgi:hypothetical protein